jgi:hypothetical protein
VVGAVLTVLAILVYARFRRDMRAARRCLGELGSQVVEAGCGAIEYATFGQGYPVLVLHGIFGGHDQGLVVARGQLVEGFRAIVPSRLLGNEGRIRSEIAAFARDQEWIAQDNPPAVQASDAEKELQGMRHVGE